MEDFKTLVLTTDMHDKDVVAKILAGESRYYEILMRRSNQLLYRVLRGYVFDRDDVEDIMQETYILAYTKLTQYRGESAFSTWLVRIGINEALRHIRKTKKRNEMHITEEYVEDYIIQDKKTPEMKIVQTEMRNAIEKAVDGLPDNLRPVFIMREIEGMSVQKVADMLDLTVENVKVRFHRAKKLLKDQLTEVNNLREAFSYGNHHCDMMVKNVMERINKIEKEKKNEKF